MATTLNVCSFNCKSIKTSVTELNDLCTNHDFVLLQETWLSRPELPMLSQINSSFTGYGIYSMDEESQILSGRPFGGIAILWRNVSMLTALLSFMIVTELSVLNLPMIPLKPCSYVSIYLMIVLKIMIVICSILASCCKL